MAKRPTLITGDAAPIRPFDASLPMALLRAREASMRHFRPMLAAYDLTEQQWRVLRALTASTTPLTVGDIAERTFLLGPSLTRILANLEKRTLIDRSVASDDQRRSNLQLTNNGRALVRKVAPNSEEIYSRIEAEFGTDRLRDLLDELQTLAALSLSSLDEEETA